MIFRLYIGHDILLKAQDQFGLLLRLKEIDLISNNVTAV